MSDKSNIAKNEHHCLFEDLPHIHCTKTNADLYVPTKERITTISNCSKERGDAIHLDIERNSEIHVHRQCVSSYCSPDHIKRIKNVAATQSPEVPLKRPRRGEDKDFEPKKHCLYCGKPCVYDHKHPEQPKSSVLVA